MSHSALQFSATIRGFGCGSRAREELSLSSGLQRSLPQVAKQAVHALLQAGCSSAYRAGADSLRTSPIHDALLYMSAHAELIVTGSACSAE